MPPKILLLLVEDEAGIRAVLEDALHDGGFDLVMAADGRQALSILDARNEEIRGLITDVNLGSGPDGWAVAHHARKLKQKLPVVYMSGASAHEWASEGVPNSVVITKPFAPAQIVSAIATLLNGLSSSEVAR